MALILLIAIILNIILGVLLYMARGQVNPPIWAPFISISKWCEKRLNRDSRSRQDIIFRGFLSYMAVLAVAIVFYFVLDGLRLAAMSADTARIVAIVILALCITTTPLTLLSRYIGAVKPQKKNVSFLRDVSHVKKMAENSYVDFTPSDDASVRRHFIGYALIMLSRGFIGPLFWFYLLGVKGVLFYSATQSFVMLVSKYGHHNSFATLPSILMRVLDLIPEVMTGIIVTICSAFVPGASVKSAVYAVFHLSDAPPYEQGGVPLHILAHALGVSLGGPVRSYEGVALKNKWAGGAKASANIEAKTVKVFTFYILIFQAITVFLIGLLLF